MNAQVCTFREHRVHFVCYVCLCMCMLFVCGSTKAIKIRNMCVRVHVIRQRLFGVNRRVLCVAIAYFVSGTLTFFGPARLNCMQDDDELNAASLQYTLATTPSWLISSTYVYVVWNMFVASCAQETLIYSAVFGKGDRLWRISTEPSSISCFVLCRKCIRINAVILIFWF